MVQEMQRKLI
jgi:hypothetical protein